MAKSRITQHFDETDEEYYTVDELVRIHMWPWPRTWVTRAKFPTWEEARWFDVYCVAF